MLAEHPQCPAPDSSLSGYGHNMSSLKVAVASIIHPQGLRMGLMVVCGLSSLVLAGPRMTVFTPVHEFGDIWDVDTLPCEFDFVNTGDTPLIIEKVHPGCGCTTTTLDKLIYAPGESGTIDATFKPNATGQLSKTVTVLSNDSESPTTTLYLRANVTPFVRTSPRLAKLPTMMLGAGGYTDVLLTPAEATFVFGDTIRTHGPTSKHMKAQLLPPPEGAPAHAKLLRINVLPSAPWGDVQCFVTVTGKASPGPDSPDIPQKPHDVKITALGAVQGQLMSDTTTFMFGGVRPGESFEKRIRITRRDGTPFRILDHRITMRPKDITLTIEPVINPDVSSYDIILRGNSNDFMGSLAGRVLIRTDVPGEQSLQFRTAGLVRYK